MNNVIFYTATEKLLEVSEQSDSGLNINAFNTTISSHTFEDGKGVITFDEDVTEIGEHAFYYCTNLTSLTLPDTVATINYFAVNGCKNLTTINVSDNSQLNSLSYRGIKYTDFQELKSIVISDIDNFLTNILTKIL